MRSRTIREGSVGLLILLGLGLFGGIVLWLRGFNPTNQSYQVTLAFSDARGLTDVSGIQSGAVVRYRGVPVGRVLEARTTPNAVEVDVEITPATLVMPRDVAIEASQSGLIGETSIDIIPRSEVPAAFLTANPLAADCNNQQIVCNGSRLEGQIGVSFKKLIDTTVQFADLFSNPEFFGEIRALTRNSSKAAAGVTTLTGEVTTLTKSVKQELGNISAAAATSATSVGQAAEQIGLTAAQVNSLVSSNRSSLVSTLDNINQTSTRLQSLVGSFDPAIADGSSNLVENLQTLSANAVEASANLRNLTSAVGSTENVVLLQQTLDSARSTFQNAQKITADLDELTGDPAFRENLRNLVNNLSGLVASTQQLQQQTQLAQDLAPVQDNTLRESSSPASRLTFQPQSSSLSAESLQVDRLWSPVLPPMPRATAADIAPATDVAQ
ncbi:MAG: MCE family protein [Timaviella obliquedivisa GSE-PSE-MK23-08B]|nr:MCE family protein [Timaviella obliquedivisa GSE-PSE-MK23-08B]